jgi:hypothetical protein
MSTPGQAGQVRSDKGRAVTTGQEKICQVIQTRPGQDRTTIIFDRSCIDMPGHID